MKEQAKEKKKNKKKKKHIFLRIVLILLLIILIAGAVFAYKVHQNGGGIQGILKTSLGHDNDTVNSLDKIYCLLLGQSQNLTDTIMLASYDPKTQEASLLSIPRDTFVGDNKAYAGGMDKINAIYQTGVENLLEEVRTITGINVEYYLKVDTEALKVLVDEIGGVYFEVPIDMNYDSYSQGLHIHLEAGYQRLDGDKAEQVVRFRHNNDGTTYPYEYGGEDLGRMRTQRAFLTALLEQTIENMDVNMVFNFLDIAEQYVETNLNFDAVKDYVPYILDFNIDNLKTATLPGVSEQAAVTGTWIYTVDEVEAEEVINELFFGITPEAETDGNTIEGNTVSEGEIDETEERLDFSGIEIEVLNGSGNSTKLSEVVNDLENAGFTVIQTGRTSTTSNTTIILRSTIEQVAETTIKELLGSENVSSGEESEVDVTIIIGTDYIL